MCYLRYGEGAGEDTDDDIVGGRYVDTEESTVGDTVECFLIVPGWTC